MKTFVLLCLAAMVSVATPIPPPEAGVVAGAAPFIPSMAMIKSFIPSADEIAALQALHTTTPAPGAAISSTPPAAGPTPPPTMPPAVASLVKKYQDAAAAFAAMAPAPV